MAYFPSVTRFSKCDPFYQNYPIFPSVTHFFWLTHFSKIDRFFQMWPIFPKRDLSFQVRPILPNVAHFCKCDQFLQLWSILHLSFAVFALMRFFIFQLSSQHPYAETFIGEPFVYTVNIWNKTEMKITIKNILSKPVRKKKAVVSLYSICWRLGSYR